MAPRPNTERILWIYWNRDWLLHDASTRGISKSLNLTKINLYGENHSKGLKKTKQWPWRSAMDSASWNFGSLLNLFPGPLTLQTYRRMVTQCLKQWAIVHQNCSFCHPSVQRECNQPILEAWSPRICVFKKLSCDHNVQSLKTTWRFHSFSKLSPHLHPTRLKRLKFTGDIRSSF